MTIQGNSRKKERKPKNKKIKLKLILISMYITYSKMKMKTKYNIKKVIKYRDDGKSWNKIINLCVGRVEEPEKRKKLKGQLIRDYYIEKYKQVKHHNLINLRNSLIIDFKHLIYYMDNTDKIEFSNRVCSDYIHLYKENKQLIKDNQTLRDIFKETEKDVVKNQLLGLKQWYCETTGCNIPNSKYLELVGKYGKIEPDEWSTDDEDLKINISI